MPVKRESGFPYYSFTVYRGYYRLSDGSRAKPLITRPPSSPCLPDVCLAGPITCREVLGFELGAERPSGRTSGFMSIRSIPRFTRLWRVTPADFSRKGDGSAAEPHPDYLHFPLSRQGPARDSLSWHSCPFSLQPTFSERYWPLPTTS
jgi:hypothetical protein